tara:strand:+ start:450 stop:692 length:243 start_codon:yes stop_codon:yes gene_type:complete
MNLLVYYDVRRFYERYFERKSWTNNAKHIYDQSRTQYAEVAVVNGRILHFKLHSASGSSSSRTLFSVDYAADNTHQRTKG